MTEIIKPDGDETVTTREIRRPIEQEMKKSYIDYSMSVIVGRALPDVRDGLKPVHRRILYSMGDMGLASNKPHRKSARVVGECFVAGTRVLTERGLIPIEEINKGERVYTQRGVSTVTELYEMPKRDLIRIELENGMAVTVTPSQPLKVLNRGLDYVWKEARDITSDDFVVMRLDYPDDLPYIELSDREGRKVELDEDVAYLTGQLLSHGHIVVGHLNFETTSSEVMDRVLRCLSDAFGHELTIEEGGDHRLAAGVQTGLHRVYRVALACGEVDDILASLLGLDGDDGPMSRRVPEPFFRSPRSVQAALLSGLVDGGNLAHGERGTVHYGPIPESMVDGVQLMMHHLGIPTCRPMWEGADSLGPGGLSDARGLTCSLEVQGRYVRELASTLPLSHPGTREVLDEMGEECEVPSMYDGVPHLPEAMLNSHPSHHLGDGCYHEIDGMGPRFEMVCLGNARCSSLPGIKGMPLDRLQMVDRNIRSPLGLMSTELTLVIKDVLENGIRFMRVGRVKAAPAERTYDLQVAGAHEFVANGILGHNCLGRYHPHGDSSVYDAMVRMAQDFSLRYPLVDGHGNFGSMDGDSAAAMRYTECRLEKIAEDILRDLEKDTVDWVDNFDSSLKEPSVLPSMVPNLLVNGSSGIAVGMATNIPPHNLREVCDALVHVIDHPSADTLDLMSLIRGPDFPTGGMIYGTNGILEAYSTGRGRLKVRARTSIEEHDGKSRIIIHEIPYQVNKANLVESIADLVKDKKVEGITDLRDESDREGMRIVIELRKDVMEEIILNQLFQQTQMEVTFGVINLALVDDQPKVLTLLEMLQAYLDYRRSVVIRRTEYDLRKARDRHHILVGLIRAVDAIDDAIRIIRGAANTEEARMGLIERFDLDEAQAKAILEMRLRALTGLEIEELRKEHAELEERIRELEGILADDGKIMTIIREELLDLKERYGDDRRTEILIDEGELDIEDLIPNEQMVIMISSDGYIKRLPLDTYKKQHRGGQGLLGMQTKEEEHVVDMFITMTHNDLLFFTDRGRVYRLKAYRIPVAGRHSKGRPIVNLLPRLEEGEKLEDNISITSFDEDLDLVFATRRGTIKRTPLRDYANIRINGIIAINLVDGDELVETRVTRKDSQVVLATRCGQAAWFDLSEVRSVGRASIGVRGMRLEDGDEVVSMAIVCPEDKLLTITENGYGKISLVSDYRKTRRGGKGVITIRTTERNGGVISVRTISDDDQLLITTLQGKVIRVAAQEIRTMGRSTQGVRIMNLTEGDKITAVARLAGSAEVEEIDRTEVHESEISIGPADEEEG